MRYEVKGGSFPVVVCNLDSGEQMITEKGSMVWMSPNMKMDTRGGGLGKMFSKAFSGESMFQNTYTAQGDGMIAFGSSFPGQIKVVTIAPGQEMIVQKSAFLAAESGVELSIHFSKKLGAGFFGGEGFIMQRLSGRGIAFVEIDGELVEYEYPAGARTEEQAAGRRGPVQHGPYRPGPCMAADHAHLQCGGVHSSLYPHWEWLTNWSLRRTNLCAACVEKSMSRSNRQCAD